MKFFAAVLLFTSALALAAPSEDVNSGVEDVDTSAADFADGDFSINEIARGAIAKAVSPTVGISPVAALTALATATKENLACV
ncbi:hypothetical protein EsDP_00007362 [Epichloe bromicola]|uniref:Uncharacterized protein n=1 Tax=Epichloe bromicola TaxID=79588 RepID=A0ABQ0D0A4_9HYPO